MRVSRDEDRFMVTVYGAGPEPDQGTLALVAEHVGGFTLTKGTGGYMVPERTTIGSRLVVEPAWQVTLFGTAKPLRDAVMWLAQWALAMGESEVCATWVPCSVTHYTNEGRMRT